MGKKKIFVGVDLHKTQFTTCVKDKSKEFDQYETEEKGYGRFLEKVATWQKGGNEVYVGVESTGNTRYFKNKLEAAGVRVKVINPLEFKIINKSVNKTDKHDAETIMDFLAVDMLPEAKICSEASEKLRRLLKGRAIVVRSIVSVKNQIHGLLTGLGMEDTKKSLQSKKGRKRVLDALKGTEYELVAQPFFDMIETVDKSVKAFEEELRRLTKDDHVVELLMTIPGCGEITAWTIRAFLDDITRYDNPKKLVGYAGLAPWVASSNETLHIGKITKHGPKELRTAFVQLVMGILRLKKKTISWRIMMRYEFMKKNKGSGKSIIAMARKLAVIVWNMLTSDKEFDVSLMTEKKLVNKSNAMRADSFQKEAVDKIVEMATTEAAKKTNTVSSTSTKVDMRRKKLCVTKEKNIKKLQKRSV